MKIIDFFEQIGPRETIELRHCRSLSEGMLTRQFHDLTNQVNWPSEQLPGLCAALLLGARITKKNDHGFIRSWGEMSTDRRPTGIDIAEARFTKLIRADNWDTFYTAAETGVRMIIMKNKSVDFDDMTMWINRRADDWSDENPDSGIEQFSLIAVDCFYSAQSPAKTIG